MSEAFYGEIMMMPYTFAPRFWAFCNGQTLNIQQNQVLFAVIEYSFGRSSPSTFQLPDLRARAPMGTGNGPGLTPRVLAERSGEDMITLDVTEIPLHNHAMQAVNNSADAESGQNAGVGILNASGVAEARYYTGEPDNLLSAQAMAVSGGSQSHENMQPYLGVNFCICMDGIFPSRS
ncbi:tail fiber protein [Photobacterium sp. WH77]|uniref:phage tail protein n=1 Tax=unclassified Photobacterium TaxID=2628852 RepID=UPI001EDA85F0|nr:MULTISPECIES: tail fiber protein [unclassified Photobacterium]MCG2836128.1 tail fiber protein [Photobacterium sp. WH77]MCG2843735.1 tail fiber protein [Photobacterium sp. WH80]